MHFREHFILVLHVTQLMLERTPIILICNLDKRLLWHSVILSPGGDRDQNEATYRLTEDIGKIFGYDHLEINPSADKQTLQLFINGKSYMLSEVGAGVMIPVCQTT